MNAPGLHFVPAALRSRDEPGSKGRAALSAPFSEPLAADEVPTCPSGPGLKHRGVDRFPDEANGAVAEQEVAAAGMEAPERVGTRGFRIQGTLAGQSPLDNVTRGAGTPQDQEHA